MSDMLEDTEYEISHNAEKQNEIIQSMLNKQVGMYQEAYNKINSIIKNTGFVGSDDFNNNQSQMSSQTGAQNQVSNASQSQQTANSKPSSSASGTITSGIKDNSVENSKITEDIMKPENTTNRKVAELKVSNSSVSVQEAQSTTLTYTIRPNDAKNKGLAIYYSAPSIATASASGGVVTINGLKPGSVSITLETVDGSKLSQTIHVTVTKKPDPPKPAPAPAPSTSSGGDGIPRVGDVVTYTGKYYYDSWGKRPSGSLYSGVSGGVVIDSMSSKAYGGNARYTGDYAVHIKSADGRYNDLGWVKLSQLSGYANGSMGIPRDQIAWTDEYGKEELIIRKSDGAKLRTLHKGDGVIKNKATERLVNFAENLNDNGEMVINGRTVSEYVNSMSNVKGIEVPDFSKVTSTIAGQLNTDKKFGNMTIENHYDNLLNVEGNVDKEALPELKEILKKSYEYTTKQMVKEVGKLGVKIRK